MIVDVGRKLDERVSPHFTWRELTGTSNATLQPANRLLEEHLVAAARALCLTVLEPIRAHFGPVHVHSAYRCPAVNGNTPGSSKTSQHMRFEAADIHVDGASLQELFDWIRTSPIPYGQLLLEAREPGPPGWVHVSLGEPWRPRSTSRQAGTKLGTPHVTWLQVAR